MRGWWWVRSTWWSAGGQLMVSWWSLWRCAAGGGYGQLVISWWSAGNQLMVIWWPANGQLVVSVTMRWWLVWSTWWSVGGQLVVSWWSVWRCAAGGGYGQRGGQHGGQLVVSWWSMWRCAAGGGLVERRPGRRLLRHWWHRVGRASCKLRPQLTVVPIVTSSWPHGAPAAVTPCRPCVVHTQRPSPASSSTPPPPYSPPVHLSVVRTISTLPLPRCGTRSIAISCLSVSMLLFVSISQAPKRFRPSHTRPPMRAVGRGHGGTTMRPWWWWWWWIKPVCGNTRVAECTRNRCQAVNR